MPSECPVCHEIAVEAEQEGEHVCHECGAIVEGRVFSTEKEKRGTTFVSTNGRTFNDRHELSRNARQRLPTVESSVTIRTLQSCLLHQVKRLNLSNEILEKARDLLFSRILPMRSSREVRGLSFRRNIFVGGCLFIVCRQNNIQVTYRRIAEVAECNMFLLGRCVKIMVKALDIKLDRLSVESLVVNLLSDFSVHDSSSEKLCTDLCQICNCFGLLSCKNPALKAISLVLLVLECQNLSPTKEKISQVLGKNSLKMEQVKKEMGRTKISLLDLGKQVPWIPASVTQRGITKHIVDIVNFHKKCGRLDLSVVKSLWMKKKEISDRNRKAKIQLAKSRLLNQEHQNLEISSATTSETNNAALSVSRNRSHARGQQVPGCHGNDLGIGTKVNSESAPPYDTSSVVLTSDASHVSGDNVTSTVCIEGLTTSADGDELDDNDILIEKLLKCGYSEEELMDGYFEARICDIQSSQQLDGEREDLDELDIAEKEMHHYLWSVAEMERLRSLKT